MSIKDAVDLLFAARERIDFYWNFYVVVVIAVVGWIVTRKEPLTSSLRMTVGSPLTDTRVILARHSYLSQRIAAFLVHATVGAAILLVVWRGNRLPNRRLGEGERPHQHGQSSVAKTLGT